MSRRWVIAAVALVLAAGITWYFASPLYTLKQMRDAVIANDADKLSAYVDFAAVREDLKSEIMAQVMAESQKENSAMGGLGVAMATAMVGPMIDGFVSPAGLRAAFAANRDRKAPARQQKQPEAAGAFNLDEDVEIERRGFDEFTVGSKSKRDGRMIFKRHGLGWKLSGVDLPPS